MRVPACNSSFSILCKSFLQGSLMGVGTALYIEWRSLHTDLVHRDTTHVASPLTLGLLCNLAHLTAAYLALPYRSGCRRSARQPGRWLLGHLGHCGQAGQQSLQQRANLVFLHVHIPSEPCGHAVCGQVFASCTRACLPIECPDCNSGVQRDSVDSSLC